MRNRDGKQATLPEAIEDLEIVQSDIVIFYCTIKNIDLCSISCFFRVHGSRATSFSTTDL